MSLSNFMRKRLVRYIELKPCVNAFIDARSPGSDKKENFTIIGPGVAENPHQHVHIREPHGFNIGAARQPPGCTNSLHSHQTAEVFIVHQGRWRFYWGELGDAGEVLLEPGDTISIPTNVFRGFENIGDDLGFMFAVLGGDDPGRVHWAPHVIEKARSYGLVLLENGSLIDTTLGETVPEGAIVVQPSTRQKIAHIRVPEAVEMARNVATRNALHPLETSQLSSLNVREFAIIGQSDNELSNPAIVTAHDFSVRLLSFNAGGRTPLYVRDGAEVLLVHSGQVEWRNNKGESIELHPGDTFTVPAGMARSLLASSEAELFVVTNGATAPRILG
jgi:quercetin dioxygenase-like cupin family protein